MLWAEPRAISAARHNMDVNYFGAAEMSSAILQEWLSPSNSNSSRTAEPKHLIFTASVLAFFSVLGYGPYTPAKWAIRGLADTLAMEMRLYPDNPVRIHVVYPGTILSPGLQRENLTKPDITMELEKADPQQTPDEVAQAAIRGLQRGQHSVTTAYLGELMRWGIMGGSPRNNWVIDTVMGWIIPVVYFFILISVHGDIKKYAAKHGHPSTYPKKA
jgi:3-dehydrosphinganine reductase